MSSLIPRAPYSQDELDRLYPRGLKLQLVQVLLRHGERSPVKARFQNAGLPAYWSYCNAARKLTSIMMSDPDQPLWDHLQWRRRIETFASDDSPFVATDQKGEFDGICQLGELTDTGRKTTLELGQRLRHLYVDQLGFMPKLISDSDLIYLRATPIPRALESVQQTFWGFYPQTARTASFPPPTIITRVPTEETLFPNESNCRRFSQLSRAFAQRAADRWNGSKEMDYINKIMGRWMPAESPRVAVDSHPRLSGIMDTINATWAHGQSTRLPNEFYDSKARNYIESIGVEEWFSGYKESSEYRKVGIGGLVGDIVGRMIERVEDDGNGSTIETRGFVRPSDSDHHGKGRIQFALCGCHDTTLAAVLSSLGCFKDELWPPFTSHIAIELFRTEGALQTGLHGDESRGSTKKENGDIPAFFFGKVETPAASSLQMPRGVIRRPVEQMPTAEQQVLDEYFVRVRYNDKAMVVPGCKVPGKHWEGDESLCTLKAFKAITDKFTPRNWRQACNDNLKRPAFPEQIEEAGY